MKKDLLLRRPMVVAALCGLLSLHLLPGFDSSFYSYITDAFVAVLLLAYGEQMLLAVFLFVAQIFQQLRRSTRTLSRYGWRGRRYLPAATYLKKAWPQHANPSLLFIAALLIFAGTLSPSDGVDSGLNLSPVELLWRAGLSLLVGVGVFLLYLWWSRNKLTTSEVRESKPEAVAATAREHLPVLDMAE